MGITDILHTGGLYLPGDAELAREQAARQELLYEFNATRPSEPERRERLLREMFAELGEGCYIEPPLHANWGGAHVHFGNNIFANFALTLVDDTHIYVGDCTMLAPTSSSPPPPTRFCPSCGKRPTSTTCPCTSGATAGWARASSCCRA